MTVVDIMLKPKQPAETGDSAAPQTPTKTQLRQNAARRTPPPAPNPNETPPPGEVLDFYPDVHDSVEDILFNVSNEPLLGNPRLDTD